MRLVNHAMIFSLIIPLFLEETDRMQLLTLYFQLLSCQTNCDQVLLNFVKEKQSGTGS